MHNFVSHGQQRVFHVVFNLGNELDSVHEQKLKQLFADISFRPRSPALTNIFWGTGS